MLLDGTSQAYRGWYSMLRPVVSPHSSDRSGTIPDLTWTRLVLFHLLLFWHLVWKVLHHVVQLFPLLPFLISPSPRAIFPILFSPTRRYDLLPPYRFLEHLLHCHLLPSFHLSPSDAISTRCILPSRLCWRRRRLDQQAST